MSEVSPEPRTAVMILVDASWEDQVGTQVTARVRMENKSASGACIRTKRRIAPGTRVRVRWRWEEFSGVVKYCRHEMGDYRIGIHRDPVRHEAEERKETRNVAQRVETPQRVDVSVREIMRSRESVIVPTVPNAAPVEENKISKVGVAELEQCCAELGQPEEVKTVREMEIPAKELLPGKRARKERRNMGSKLLQLAHWRKKEQLHGNGNTGNNASNNADNSASQKSAHATIASAVAEKRAADPTGTNTGNVQVELLPMEDIYRAAGIVNPRRGYSVTKVVEMLKSEYLRGLSKEMKRASVLMALDAAGVAIDDVLRDAKVRQEAMDAYEAEQRKQFEALWAQKAEENMQINAELERVKTSYAERIKRNQDGVAREKATFVGWLTTKQQEAQEMNEAVELCVKPVAGTEPVGGNLPAVGMVGANTKVV